MENAIVGVRYIGKKDLQEDTVCNTGATWTPGQVHNFAFGIAKRLLEHTDSFVQMEIDMDGQTFMSAGKSAVRETAPYVNVSAMTVDQLVHLARFEFNRVVNPEGKTVEQLRQEVQSLMVTHSMDLIADEKASTDAGDYRVPIIYQATPEEHAALKDGTLALRLVPVVAAGEILRDLESLTQDDGAGDTPPDLEAMSKEELVAFALERFSESIDKRKSLNTIRDRVTELLSGSQE